MPIPGSAATKDPLVFAVFARVFARKSLELIMKRYTEYFSFPKLEEMLSRSNVAEGFLESTRLIVEVLGE